MTDGPMSKEAARMVAWSFIGPWTLTLGPDAQAKLLARDVLRLRDAAAEVIRTAVNAEVAKERQIGRAAMAYEIAEYVKQPCLDRTGDKDRQKAFDEAAMLSGMAITRMASAEFTKLPVEVQLSDESQEVFANLKDKPHAR